MQSLEDRILYYIYFLNMKYFIYSISLAKLCYIMKRSARTVKQDVDTIGLGYRMARLSKSAREVLPDGDFRDWNEIETWADGIAQALASSAAA